MAIYSAGPLIILLFNLEQWRLDGSQIVSCSSDCTVKFWDAKRAECLKSIKPPHTQAAEPAILAIYVHPTRPEEYVLIPRSSTMLVMQHQGTVVKTMQSPKKEGEFVACCVGPRGACYYALGEDSVLYCFSAESGKLEHQLQVYSGKNRSTSNSAGSRERSHRSMPSPASKSDLNFQL